MVTFCLSNMAVYLGCLILIGNGFPVAAAVLFVVGLVYTIVTFPREF